MRGIPDLSGQNMTIGTVKFSNATKGSGFITPEGGGKDVFVHSAAVEIGDMRTFSEGQRVSFDIQPDAKGARPSTCGRRKQLSGRKWRERKLPPRPPTFLRVPQCCKNR
jgi:CspA family cold shock protein